jgi:hypothetical protein
MVAMTARADADDAPSETGAIHGEVRDAKTGEPLPGVTVVITSPAAPGPASEITGDDGRYRFDDVVAGTYVVTFYYSGATVERAGVTVAAGTDLAVDQRIALNEVGGETIALTAGAASVRFQAETWLVPPDGSYELGATFAFVTADAVGDEAELRFTDVLLVRALGRYSVTDRLQLFAGVDLLPKQPTGADEWVWQGASAAGRLALGKRWATDLRVAGGPLLGGHGMWESADLSLVLRHEKHETVGFQLAAGASAMALQPDEVDDAAWLAEGVLAAETLFRTPYKAMFGVWVGAEYRLPLAHSDTPMTTGAPPIDPDARVNFRLGALYGVVEDLDLFVELAVLDRGDRADPATTLPILDGGFDQKHLIFGVVRRFSPESAPPQTWIAH